MKYFKCK